MANRFYGESYRNEAVQRISVEGHSVTSVARDLSVSTGTIHRWVCDAVAANALPHQRADTTSTPQAAPPATTPSDEAAATLRQALDRITALEDRPSLYTENATDPPWSLPRFVETDSRSEGLRKQPL